MPYLGHRLAEKYWESLEINFGITCVSIIRNTTSWTVLLHAIWVFSGGLVGSFYHLRPNLPCLILQWQIKEFLTTIKCHTFTKFNILALMNRK